MFPWLGRFAYRRRILVLAAGLLFVAAGAVWGTGVFGALSGGGFEDPATPSARAAALAERTLGRDGADVVLLYTNPTLPVTDPAYRAAVEQVLAGLPGDRVSGVTTYWATGAAQLASRDGRATSVLLRLAGATEDERARTYRDVRPLLERAPPGFTVQLGGPAVVLSDVSTQVERDIARAERISLPLVLVLLLVVFGGLVAASLPLAIGGLAILGAFVVLRLLTLVTSISVFAINIVTMLGLGLAIDYALFVVSRFREELAGGVPVPAALERTMASAGRTVAVSGVTVGAALSGLLLFPQGFLRSMGLGGMAAVGVAVLGALTVLPALLAVLGRRVDALRLPRHRRREPAAHRGAARHAAGEGPDEGPWSRVARSVMRRPLAYLAVTVPVLLLAGAPFLGVRFGGVDSRVLPAGAESRVVAERLAADFPGGGQSTLRAVVSLPRPAAASGPELAAYAERLRAVPGVDTAGVGRAAGDTAEVTVTFAGDPMSPAARTLTERVRAVPPPAGASVLVGGETPALVDLLASLGARLPWMALIVVGVTFLLLFLAFGSLVLPLKALVMNVLSLGATFGVLVWIFQEGHLSGLLGFTATGTLDATNPVLMLAIVFGLSMDYEVFLLSRVREQWDRTGDNVAAVATGLQRTGGIITSAALLIAVVIGAFGTSGISLVKMVGVGLLVAIIVDASVVRILVVPATMRLLGPANWWAPGPLARWWARTGLSDREEPAAGRLRPSAPEGRVSARMDR
ncbi:MAG: MMPL family transporter [Actinomycetota bacterium]